MDAGGVAESPQVLVGASSFKRDKEIRQAKEAGTDPPPFRYVDIDGIAEVVDVLRGCGLTEASDPMISSDCMVIEDAKQTRRLACLHFNHGDGNMKNDKSSSYYDKVHPCWVTVQSLVAKGTFHNETYERWVKNVVRESNFDKLGYEAKWNRSSGRSKTKGRGKNATQTVLVKSMYVVPPPKN